MTPFSQSVFDYLLRVLNEKFAELDEARNLTEDQTRQAHGQIDAAINAVVDAFVTKPPKQPATLLNENIRDFVLTTLKDKLTELGERHFDDPAQAREAYDQINVATQAVLTIHEVQAFLVNQRRAQRSVSQLSAGPG